jgi:putative addiction module antidote
LTIQRKVFKTGNSVVVSLPQEFLEALNTQLGENVEMLLDRENQQVIIKPLQGSLEKAGITADFAQQLDAFIKEYRPALEKLAE